MNSDPLDVHFNVERKTSTITTRYVCKLYHRM